MSPDAQHFVVLGPALDISALEAIKQHVWRNRARRFIVWYDLRFKGNPFLARLASDLASCDVLFRPMPAYVPDSVMSEYGNGRSRPIAPWASSSDMLRAWVLDKSGGYGDAAPPQRP